MRWEWPGGDGPHLNSATTGNTPESIRGRARVEDGRCARQKVLRSDDEVSDVHRRRMRGDDVRTGEFEHDMSFGIEKGVCDQRDRQTGPSKVSPRMCQQKRGINSSFSLRERLVGRVRELATAK
jgi:hypothetical protein